MLNQILRAVFQQPLVIPPPCDYCEEIHAQMRECALKMCKNGVQTDAIRLGQNSNFRGALVSLSCR